VFFSFRGATDYGSPSHKGKTKGGTVMKIDWKKKLTSRKLWLAVASFVSMLVIALGGTESESTQVAALIMAGATVIGYIIGEGLADSGNIYNIVQNEEVNDDD